LACRDSIRDRCRRAGPFYQLNLDVVVDPGIDPAVKDE
jgi:hypothetical protein